MGFKISVKEVLVIVALGMLTSALSLSLIDPFSVLYWIFAGAIYTSLVVSYYTFNSNKCN